MEGGAESDYEEGAEYDEEALGTISEAVNGANAIGVVPVDSATPYGIGTTCGRDEPPVGSALATLVSFRMDDEDDVNLTGWSVGWWTPATATPTMSYNFDGNNTTLRFCRVTGSNFKPKTTSPGDTKNFYAALSLGTSCPAGSTRVGYFIDNEDDENANSRSGLIAPNVSNTNTTLKFCVFRSAATTMGAFPNLGAPYAVFHDWDPAQQPAWVLKKHKHEQDDEDDNNANRVTEGEAGAVAALQKMVSHTNNTVYEFAQVR